MLEVKDLVVAYGPAKVLHEISLRVGKGEFVAVLGRNGAGKTTLLQTIMGALRPVSGQVVFRGEDLKSLSPWQRVRRGLALVPEGRRIFAPLSVKENLELGAFQNPRGWTRRLEEVLELFPRLKERLDVAAGVLSGGEQQMLAMARALMAQPRCLLLDEPSMGLAPKVASLIFDTLAKLKGRLSLLVVEQNVTRVLSLADRVIVLDGGRIKLEAFCSEIDRQSLEAAYFGA